MRSRFVAKALAGVALLGGMAAYVTQSSGPTAAAAAETQRSAPGGGDSSCAGLARLNLPNVRIVTATSMAEGADVPSAGLRPMFGASPTVAKGLPAFCRVAGRIHPEAGSDIGFEVWMPSTGWDGRLHGVGIGGFAGMIDYHTLGLALKGGQAGVATDTGHSAAAHESDWAKGQPAKVRDYAWRAIHLSTVTAKDLIRAFYGRQPDRSYFVGCSGGGRQGLVAAARFPEDYDGIVSGAPAASFTELVMAMTLPIQAQLPAGAALRSNQVPVIQAEVLRQCDAVDGQADGLVDDPRQCRFDAARLACGVSSSPQCLSQPQVTALQRIYRGPRTSAGRVLADAFLPSGSEAGNPMPSLGWESYIVSNAGTPPGSQLIANGTLQNLIQQPFATTATFDFDRDPARLKAAMHEIDAPHDLRRFFARGGKLILWHGWADAAIPPEATLRYRNAMLQASGRDAATGSRLFMVPGVQHCMGGLGPDSFGQLNAPQPGDNAERSVVSALQAWVEGKRPAPEMLIGRRGHGGLMGMPASMPERQRLLCAWPRKAVLRAGADPDQAASYSCK